MLFEKVNNVKILNLSQHKATPEQIAQGLMDMDDEDREKLKDLLTFSSGDINPDEFERRAKGIEELINKYHINNVMIAGMPAFMIYLYDYLVDRYYVVYFSFSERVSQEREIDGKVVKTSIFQHKFFYSL